jgi:hypothetical protein
MLIIRQVWVLLLDKASSPRLLEIYMASLRRLFCIKSLISREEPAQLDSLVMDMEGSRMGP